METGADGLVTSLQGDLSFLLARANALSLAAGNAALAAHGLKARSYSVLAVAVEGTRPTQREIAAFLRLDPSQVVSLVDDLQRRGLVERRPDPADRRANVVIATDEGRTLHAAASAAARGAEAVQHAALSDEERAQLAALLRRIAFED
jgi:DNA-binding MarR family transcriptional regulator